LRETISIPRALLLALVWLLAWSPPDVHTAAGQTIDTAPVVYRVEAPPSLEATATRVRAIDRASIESALARAGLPVPPSVEIQLIPEDDPRARATAPWVVGRAFGDGLVWIFPQRVTTYPYDSTESVVRHEIVHLAISWQAGSLPIPRWFHEGVAVSVDAGWDLSASLRLLLTAADRSGVADLERLFASERQADTTEAYLLSAALVDDLRQRHGAGLPGAIVRRVAEGATFSKAFAAETGELPEQAAARAWQGYRRWSRWLPVLTDASAVWTLILVLAFAAFFARVVQRIRQRRAWDEEEAEREGAPFAEEVPWHEDDFDGGER
jgi:hypothetical protein